MWLTDIHTDSPDGSTGKTCLGGGLHCPSASSSGFFEQIWMAALLDAGFASHS